MASALIEIDPAEGWSPGWDDEARRRRRNSPLTLAILCAVVVLAALTGPALLPEGGSLRPLWHGTTETGFFTLTREALFQVEPAGPELRLTARDPATGHWRWSAPLDGALARLYARGPVVTLSRFVPGPIYEMTTRVIDVTTGRRAWVYPVPAAPLAYLGDDVAVVVDLADPPPAQDPGRLDDGTTRAHRIRALDVHTGRPLWSTVLPAGTLWALPGVRQGADGLAQLAPGADWMLVAQLTGQAQVWDLATGAVLARAEFGPAQPRWYAAALAGAVVVRTDAPDGTFLTGFAPRTLTPVWRMDAPDVYAVPFDCGDILCVTSDRGVWALSPRHGGLVWQSDDLAVRATAGATRLLSSQYGSPLTWVEVATGRARAPDDEWRVVDAGEHGGAFVVAQVTRSGFARVGVADPATGTVRFAGEVRGWALPTRCRLVADVLACADREQLRVWRAATA